MKKREQEVADALCLEQVKLSEFVDKTSLELQSRIEALDLEMAKRGMTISGPRNLRHLDLRFNRAASIIDRSVETRAELGRKFPELLSAEQLKALKHRLDSGVSALVQSIYDDSARHYRASGQRVPEARNRTCEQRGAQLRTKIDRAIQKLTLEARLGLNEEQLPMTLNISNSTIGNLNLGTVVGNLTASVNALNQQGQADLAREIKALAEALASTDIPNDQRRDLLEHLSVVSYEVTLPPDQRKPATLRLAIQALQKGLMIAGQLAPLWQPIEQILKATGIVKG